MIKKLIYVLVLPLSILFLISCKGDVYREWSVENSASQQIHIKASMLSNSDTIYESLAQDEKVLLAITTEDRGNPDPQMAYDVFSYLNITNDSGQVYQVDWTDNDSWDIYIEETSINPDKFNQTYNLIVKDADFN